MAEKTYLDFSNEDSGAAIAMHNCGYYNHTVRLCQQSIEKRLKHFLELHGTDISKEMFRSHKLTKLCEKYAEIIQQNIPAETFKNLYKLTEFYFECNYPSEYNVIISKEASLEYLNFMLEINKSIDEYLEGKNSSSVRASIFPD